MPPYIISIDDFKEKIPGYQPEKASDYHTQSAKMADREFDKVIKTIRYDRVILLAGGSASGKTEYLRTILEGENALIFDGTLSTSVGAEIKIRKALKYGKTIEIHYIFPDDIKRAFIAFLARDRRFSDDIFYETHSGSRATLLWISNNYPNTTIKIIESIYINEKLKYEEINFDSLLKRLEFIKSIQYNAGDIAKMITKEQND